MRARILGHGPADPGSRRGRRTPAAFTSFGGQGSCSGVKDQPHRGEASADPRSAAPVLRAPVEPNRALRDWPRGGGPQLRSLVRGPAPGGDRAGVRAHRGRLGALLARRDAGHLHGLGERRGAALDGGLGAGLGDRGVRDAARLDGPTQGARREAGPARRTLGGDPAADRALAARGRRPGGARRAQRLRRLRRAAGARPRSPARSAPCTWRSGE